MNMFWTYYNIHVHVHQWLATFSYNHCHIGGHIVGHCEYLNMREDGTRSVCSF